MKTDETNYLNENRYVKKKKYIIYKVALLSVFIILCCKNFTREVDKNSVRKYCVFMDFYKCFFNEMVFVRLNLMLIVSWEPLCSLQKWSWECLCVVRKCAVLSFSSSWYGFEVGCQCPALRR